MAVYITRGDPAEPFYWTGEEGGWGGPTPWTTDEKRAADLVDETAGKDIAERLPSSRLLIRAGSDR